MRSKKIFEKFILFGCDFCFFGITYTKGKKENTYFLNGKGVKK